MDIKDLQEQRDQLVQDFIQAMNEWLEAFNEYTDRLMEKEDE